MPNSILEKLQKIIQFEYSEELDGFTVLREEELCGMITFAIEALTPEELRQLGHELIAMADEAEPDPSEAEMHDWRTHPSLTPEQRGGA